MNKIPTLEEYKQESIRTQELIEQTLEANKIHVACALAASMRIMTGIFTYAKVPHYMILDFVKAVEKAAKAMDTGTE